MWQIVIGSPKNIAKTIFFFFLICIVVPKVSLDLIVNSEGFRFRDHLNTLNIGDQIDTIEIMGTIMTRQTYFGDLDWWFRPMTWKFAPFFRSQV